MATKLKLIVLKLEIAKPPSVDATRSIKSNMQFIGYNKYARYGINRERSDATKTIEKAIVNNGIKITFESIEIMFKVLK